MYSVPFPSFLESLLHLPRAPIIGRDFNQICLPNLALCIDWPTDRSIDWLIVRIFRVLVQCLPGCFCSRSCCNYQRWSLFCSPQQRQKFFFSSYCRCCLSRHSIILGSKSLNLWSINAWLNIMSVGWQASLHGNGTTHQLRSLALVLSKLLQLESREHVSISHMMTNDLALKLIYLCFSENSWTFRKISRMFFCYLSSACVC